MRLQCGVSFSQLRTCRRPLACSARRPSDGGQIARPPTHASALSAAARSRAHRGGTFESSGPSPSAIVGCARTASASREYEISANMVICTAAMTFPASAPIIVKPIMLIVYSRRPELSYSSLLPVACALPPHSSATARRGVSGISSCPRRAVADECGAPGAGDR